MTEPDPSSERDHRRLRELIGDYALGLLPPAESVALEAHLDGCPRCRAELAELAPLAADLKLVDPARIGGLPTPPPELGERIRAAVRAEVPLRDRRDRSATRRRRLRAALVPVGSALAGVAATVLVMTTVVPGQEPPAVVTEELAVQVDSARITGTHAELVPHTWGLEVKLVASGLASGTTYRGVVVARDGRTLSAGAFLGTGSRPVVCNLQAALLRADAVSFRIVDGRNGDTVLSAALPAKA